MAQADPSQSTGRDTGTNPAEGFARFKVDLAKHLDFPTIQRLSTLLELKPEEIDSIKRSKAPGLEMVNLLDEREFITPSDITEFLKKLKELGLASLAARIQESFQAKTSQAKKDQDLYLEGFGLFKVNLAKHLDFPMIQQLSILLVLEHGEIDSIKRSESPGLEMVNLLDERGIITHTDISDLVKMLGKLELAGLAARIRSSFQTKTSQAKKDQDLYLEGFARFKVDLAEHLDFPTIQRLSTLLGLKPGEIGNVKRSKTPGLEMVNLLDNQGFITPSDITEILKKLKELGLASLAARIQESFQAKTSQAKKDQDLYLEGFGLFKVDLADHLNVTTINRLSTLLELKPEEIDSIKRSKTPGLEMVNLLDERGIITHTDISVLLKMLGKLELAGLAARIQSSFQTKTSQAKKDQDLYLEEKKRHLIKYSKIAYRKHYETAKRFPSLSSVNSIFVEGGIYYLAQEGNSMQKPDVLEPLESYNDILSSPKTKSMRKIIEADPGFGKSTLASQLVYDWCTEDPESPLRDVEILIFLQLRQLEGVKSIYTAIKHAIVPEDEDMDESCIKEILKAYKKSVVMLFDSYDEYPDKKTKTHISSIIEMKMFLDILVIILTRTLILPPNLHPETKRIRLTGFGVAERRNYVLKALADDVQLADRIEIQLQRNPFLRDLCQVPLFSTMVAHIAHEWPEVEIFSTVTRFFTYVIACVHNHMKIKKDASTGVPAFETELAKLYRIAFDGLTQKNQQLAWENTYLVSELGQEFYDNYIKLGMLAQEVVFDISQCRYKTVARIWHKIICEFYASRHLVWILSEGASSAAPSINVKETLNRINPLDFQYVYRFACGLNKSAADIIIKHLLETKEGRQFAILCMLEQEEKSDQFQQSVKDLVSSIIHITKYDAILLQRSTIQVLEVASAKQIPISCVYLGGCSPRVDESGLNLILKSGLSLSILSSLQKLVILDINRRLTNEELAAILSYSSQCTSLKELEFDFYDPPDTIPVGSIPSSLKSRNVKVWNYSDSDRRLNLQTGRWQACDSFGNLPGKEGYIEPRSSEDDTDEEASGDDEERQPVAYVTTSHYNQPAEKRPAPDEFHGGNFKWARRK